MTNFQTIINDLTADVSAMKATPPFVDTVERRAADASVTQPIVDALTNVSTNSIL